MRRYQAVLILKPDMEEDDLKDFRGRFHTLLEDGKAVNVETLEDNVRDLTHAIKKHPRAYFWRVAFEAESDLVVKLREEIRHDERLLRQIYLNAVSEPYSPDTSPDEEEAHTGEEKTEKVEKKVEKKAEKVDNKAKNETDEKAEKVDSEDADSKEVDVKEATLDEETTQTEEEKT